MGQAVQLARAEYAVHYERQRPEETTLNQLVQTHAESFSAPVEAETGTGLPKFDAFLECDIVPSQFCSRAVRDNTAHERRATLVNAARRDNSWVDSGLLSHSSLVEKAV